MHKREDNFNLFLYFCANFTSVVFDFYLEHLKIVLKIIKFEHRHSENFEMFI